MIFGEKIELKVDVNHHDFVSDIQTPSRLLQDRRLGERDCSSLSCLSTGGPGSICPRPPVPSL